MALDTVTKLETAFLRLVSLESVDDDALVERGEVSAEVVLLALAEGAWRAQRFLCNAGLSDLWRTRSTALVWSGSDAADGGRYWALPTDFLRLSRDDEVSSLVTANGDPWGWLVDEMDDTAHGNGYYLSRSRLWLCRTAQPPTTLYMDYIQRLPEIVAGLDITIATGTWKFPIDARTLIVSEAAAYAEDEAWLPDDSAYQKIQNRLTADRKNASDVAKRDRAPLVRRPTAVFGTHYPFH